MRSRFPAGSRTAASRLPHGWVVGSSSTSTPGVAATFSNLWLWPLLLGLAGAAFVLPGLRSHGRGGEEEEEANLSAYELIARGRNRRGRGRPGR